MIIQRDNKFPVTAVALGSIRLEKKILPPVQICLRLCYYSSCPANTRRSPSVVLMLDRRRRRRASIKTTLGKHPMITGSRFSVVSLSPLLLQAVFWQCVLMARSPATLTFHAERADSLPTCAAA